MRIVSLLPAATEIVYRLGLGEQLVGVTFECDEPARARVDNAVVVAGRDTSAMSAADIDAYVAASVANGTDLYRLDSGALAALQPDLVITQDLCRVCAVDAPDVTAALAHLGCTARVCTLDPDTLEGVLLAIAAVAAAAGQPRRGVELVEQLRRRIDAVRAAVAGRPRPRVALVEWVDPPYLAGHWIPDQVRMAGGESVSPAGSRSAATTWDRVAATRPDVVIVGPCGFGLTSAVEQARVAAVALPDVPVWAIDGNALIVRPGPRIVDGIEAIAAVLHPQVFTARPDQVARLGAGVP